MEVDEIQTQASKFSRVANGKIDSSKIGNRTTANSHHQHQYPDEGTDGELRRGLTGSSTAVGGGGNLGMGDVSGGGGGNRLRNWQHSSRIIRVSRASGGKDRHSKVWTAKGPRDRRVRLSVSTAIQFYDLQDRLGFDQPSKAVEWLIKAAADAISELPSLSSAFSETPRQQSDEKRPGLGGDGSNVEQGFDSSAELELDGEPGFSQGQQQHGSNLSKSSACSSTSETSKGSGGLSLSRTQNRVKARERARERTAKEKERETESTPRAAQQEQDVNQQLAQSSSSFTQLLTAGIGSIANAGVSSSPMDYFNTTGLMGASSSARGTGHHPSSGFSGQIIQLGNSGMPQAMMTVSPFSIGGEQPHHHAELHHFPFIPDHHLVVPAQNATGAAGTGNDHYNLNFSISPSSSGFAGFNNRGTLQSNSSPSLFPHLQRFSASPLDGSTLPFFLGAAVENQHHQNQHHGHHHSASQYPSGLHLCYGDNGGRHSDQKGKGKN